MTDHIEGITPAHFHNSKSVHQDTQEFLENGGTILVCRGKFSYYKTKDDSPRARELDENNHD